MNEYNSNLTKEREGWMLLMMGSWLYVNSTGARHSTESTVSFTGCSEGTVCGGVLQVSMVDDKLMVEVKIYRCVSVYSSSHCSRSYSCISSELFLQIITDRKNSESDII